MEKNYVLDRKSYDFALHIVELYKYLSSDKREFILSRQVVRSGTAIGALVREAKYAQSHADYLSKYSIALKEANETLYWLELLHDSAYLDDAYFLPLHNEANELTAILVATVNKLKTNHKP